MDFGIQGRVSDGGPCGGCPLLLTLLIYKDDL